MPAFFVKVTESGNGVVVSDKNLTKKTVKIKGQDVQLSVQVENVKFGFFALENANVLSLVRGEQLPVSITKVAVLDQENKPMDLMWCTPD
jgi:hypothetical protein